MALGFYHNMERCIGCGACQIACKDKFDIQQAGPRPRRVDTFETGTFSKCSIFSLSIGCNHCNSPACVAVCPTGAMFKRESDGVVLHADDVCIGCQSCTEACPYKAPQYMEDMRIVIKCDSCQALREAGMNPICIDSCAQRALDFGEIEELRVKYGDDLVSTCVAMADEEATGPNIVIRPRAAALEGEPVALYL